MNDLNYFDPKELSFSLSDTGILSLDWKGTRYDAVQLTRLFPFSLSDTLAGKRSN